MLLGAAENNSVWKEIEKNVSCRITSESSSAVHFRRPRESEIGKEEVQASLLEDDMIVYIQDLKNPLRNCYSRETLSAK